MRLVREAKRRVLSTRWVLHYKDGHNVSGAVLLYVILRGLLQH